MHMDMDTNMKLIGKRFPYLATFKIGCSKEGKVQVVDVEIFADCGSYASDNSISVLVDHIDNGVLEIFVKVKGHDCFICILQPTTSPTG